MKTLNDIFQSGGHASAPYNAAIKVAVCGIGQVVQYRNANGDQRESMTVGFADQSMAVKGTLYDLTKKETLRVGTTVMLMNTIIKRDMKTIVITNKSKVLKTSPLANISEERIKEGHALACPPPADRVQIKSVHSSPVKTLVTIRGQIISVSELCILFVVIQMNLYYVSLLHTITFLNKFTTMNTCFKQEEMERTVKVGGVDTSVRSLRVKDETAVCKVTLWRDFAKRKTSVGSHIQITDVAVQLYNDEKSLSTTTRTTLEVRLMKILMNDNSYLFKRCFNAIYSLKMKLFIFRKWKLQK